MSDGTLPTTSAEVRTTQVETRNGERGVMIARAGSPQVLDRERVVRVGQGTYESRVNKLLVDSLGHLRSAPHAVIFEAAPSAGQRRTFAEDVTEEEIVAFGESMVRTQLQLFEQVARHGVYLLVGVEFGNDELRGYDKGAARLAERLERDLTAAEAEGGDTSRLRLELWLLDHFAIWSGLSADRFVETKLAQKLVSTERKIKQLKKLLEHCEA